MNQEIERKFIISYLPDDLDSNTGTAIQQGYLCTEDDREVRIRQKNNRYFLTAKCGNGLQRNEAETEISAIQFNTFWPLTEGRRIYKTRYEYPLGNYLIELDVYEKELKSLAVAEVEFESVEDAYLFIKPDFLGQEVTEIFTYRNMCLALKGLPTNK